MAIRTGQSRLSGQCVWNSADHVSNRHTNTSNVAAVCLPANGMREVTTWPKRLGRLLTPGLFLLLVEHDDHLHDSTKAREEVAQVRLCEVGRQTTKEHLGPVAAVALLLLHASRVAGLGVDLVRRRGMERGPTAARYRQTKRWTGTDRRNAGQGQAASLNGGHRHIDRTTCKDTKRRTKAK